MKDREELRNCFRRNLVQVEGDTELFDTELTIDQILKWHTSKLNEAQAEAYDNCKFWLEDRLTSKASVADVCGTRAKVLRGEIEVPKARFQSGEQR